VREFKGMVKALHREGIEVILDVVYNHTAEGNHLGPMLSFKGVDNKAYYRSCPTTSASTWTSRDGQLAQRVHPSVLQLIMDSLRYCVIECHVDGFRFDLASTLAREPVRGRPPERVLRLIHQDPVLSRSADRRARGTVDRRLQVGNFASCGRSGTASPRHVRDFCALAPRSVQLASRLTRSRRLSRGAPASLSRPSTRPSHDGFTLRDLCPTTRSTTRTNHETHQDALTTTRS
jgi:glycogen operon protein